MTPSKAAKALKVSRQTVHNRIKAGKLEAVKVRTLDGQWYYDVKLKQEPRR